MAQVVTENERKFAFAESAELPDLSAMVTEQDLQLARQGAIELRATYFDTADLRLLRSGVTLRCRLGGTDEGWHLKLPTSTAHERTEVRRPLGPLAGEAVDAPAAPDAGDVPADLAELVFARLRRAPLEVVAEVRTLRTVLDVLDASGSTLVEVADDIVTARPAGGEPVTWREVEVEQSPGGAPIAEQIAALLIAAGARPDEGGPKLAHALGVPPASAGGPAAGDRPVSFRSARRHRAHDPLRQLRDRRHAAAEPVAAQDSDRSAGSQRQGAPRRLPRIVAAVVSHLRAQTEELARQDLAVRRQEPDGVHDMRVAARRLTSALETYGALFDDGPLGRLHAELKWIFRLLGEARDTEVMRATLESELDGLPGEQRLGPVRAIITDRLVGVQAVAAEALAEAMRSERYAMLLDELAAFVAEPPLRGESGKRLESAARRGVRRDLRAVRRRMARAAGQQDGERERSLHEARKRSKRARYALETIEPVYGSPARRLAARYEALQAALGDHHDAVVIGELLREEGARAGVRVGENGYTFGVLAGIQRCRAEASEQAGWAAFARADRRRARRFLR